MTDAFIVNPTGGGGGGGGNPPRGGGTAPGGGGGPGTGIADPLDILGMAPEVRLYLTRHGRPLIIILLNDEAPFIALCHPRSRFRPRHLREDIL